jgi:hypothetical protein
VTDGAPFDHDGEEIRPRSRTFIPARLEDNPHLATRIMRSMLQSLPEPLRSQLLYGNFAAQSRGRPVAVSSRRYGLRRLRRDGLKWKSRIARWPG